MSEKLADAQEGGRQRAEMWQKSGKGTDAADGKSVRHKQLQKRKQEEMCGNKKCENMEKGKPSRSCPKF